jgi:hypothetical protein
MRLLRLFAAIPSVAFDLQHLPVWPCQSDSRRWGWVSLTVSHLYRYRPAEARFRAKAPLPICTRGRASRDFFQRNRVAAQGVSLFRDGTSGQPGPAESGLFVVHGL